MKPIAKRLVQSVASVRRVKCQAPLILSSSATAHLLGVALLIIDQANAKKQITPESQVIMKRAVQRIHFESSIKINAEITIEMSSRGRASKFLAIWV